VAWNEEISKDWGGQVMDDYLSAIDAVAKENYVDKTRWDVWGGASWWVFCFFYFIGNSTDFKTFIAHDGVYNTQSMFGTTEEVFFSNWDFGGAIGRKIPLLKNIHHIQPDEFSEKWNKPILIIQGGKDFRVPMGQGQEAFQTAQLRGLKVDFYTSQKKTTGY
jgi:dipeptidyl aminopeptidase/acylaminoacyl peptidase